MTHSNDKVEREEEAATNNPATLTKEETSMTDVENNSSCLLEAEKETTEAETEEPKARWWRFDGVPQAQGLCAVRIWFI